jgi:hypothetical protein
MVFATSVVNTHSLSHLFEDDLSSIEHCNTCDEFVLSVKDDLLFISPEIPTHDFIGHQNINEAPTLIYIHVAPKRHRPGKYYNKPPPFKLA